MCSESILIKGRTTNLPLSFIMCSSRYFFFLPFSRIVLGSFANKQTVVDAQRQQYEYQFARSMICSVRKQIDIRAREASFGY